MAKNDMKKQGKTKEFFHRLVEKIDKKMEDKTRQSKCGCSSDKSGGTSCCV